MGYYFNSPEAIEYCLDKFPESLHPRFPKEFVLESVKFILESNNLNFDNEYFNQIKGTAMGTKGGCSFLKKSVKNLKKVSIC